ncbi:brct domain containing protein [Stylonychia lemnae]|uniref:Brct domain containing protein n=1 Tax=Stylonychia lemnae TaxID=5949 RepID=A0A078AKZ7_STYLE|nr:brct domain containing protein [Stylonychia lemnae]|eukprot:CDW82869.1 brct domain containing protein [Stylonychia lemnae]
MQALKVKRRKLDQQKDFIIEPTDNRKLTAYFKERIERLQDRKNAVQILTQNCIYQQNLSYPRFIQCARDEKGNKKKNEADYEDREEQRERKMKKYDEDKEYMNEARGPLGGGSYAVSGVFEDITREKLEEFIKKNGGRLVTQVTTKCDYLIIGKLLDDGRKVQEGNKYRNADRLKKKIMTEKEFEQFCRIRFQNPDFLLGRKKKKDTTNAAEDHFVANDVKTDELIEITDISQLLTDENIPSQKASDIQLQNQQQKSVSSSLQKNRLNLAQNRVNTPMTNQSDGSSDSNCGNQTSSLQNGASNQIQIKKVNKQSNLINLIVPKQIIQRPKIPEQQQLWTDKYAPQELKDVIGNKGPINNFKEWLQDWEDVVLRGMKKDVQPKGGWGRQNYQDLPRINAKACMISGPPGIGKSSIVRIFAKDLGYHLIEFNASDNRSKKTIDALIKDMSTSTTIKNFENQQVQQKQQQKKKILILMDEVDGVGANDRGGLGALILIIKKTLNPIVCIANDGKHRKLQSLVNHCYELKFSKYVLKFINYLDPRMRRCQKEQSMQQKKKILKLIKRLFISKYLKLVGMICVK